MPVAEAMASGVPVITCNTTALPEVAGDGALLVDPLSEPALTHAMATLLNDADLRASLVRAGLRHVRQFDWEQSAAVMLAAFRKHLSRNQRCAT
jgi:glycosyltransferase involved in cell wall biosynthesis